MESCLRPRRFVFALMALFIASPTLVHAYQQEIKAAAARIAESLGKSGKKTVAVVDFTDLQGNVTELGRFLAEELSITLATESPRLDVIDRTHLKALLQEHKLATSGVIDPQTARKLGEIAGVDVLITGSITPFGDSVRLSVKAMDAATARLLSAASVDIPKTKAVEELLARGIGVDRRAGEAATSPPSPGRSETSQSTVRIGAPPLRATVQEIEFELRRCANRGDVLKCELLLTNRSDKDQRVGLSIYLDRYSRVIDGSGNEYRAASVQVGQSRTSSSEEGILTSGVPTKATVSFADVPASVSEVALLEIAFYGGGRFFVQFRRVPIG